MRLLVAAGKKGLVPCSTSAYHGPEETIRQTVDKNMSESELDSVGSGLEWADKQQAR